MKKVIIFILIALSLPVIAYATPPINLLDGATATGAGTAKIPLETYKDWGCKAKITGAPTNVTVCLQGDPASNTDFADMICIEFTSAELFAGFATRGGQTQVANSVRGNVVTLTGGTNPTVSLWCTGVR